MVMGSNEGKTRVSFFGVPEYLMFLMESDGRILKVELVYWVTRLTVKKLRSIIKDVVLKSAIQRTTELQWISEFIFAAFIVFFSGLMFAVSVRRISGRGVIFCSSCSVGTIFFTLFPLENTRGGNGLSKNHETD